MILWHETLRALAALLVVAPAGATGLQDAVEARDVLKLEELSRVAAMPDEAMLASGAALSLRHKDEQALAILEPLSNAAATTEIRAGTCWALSDIYLRQGRYAAARAALTCAQKDQPLSAEAAQVLSYAAVLAGEKPMRLTQPAAGRLDVRRDEAGLLRVRVEINGEQKYAVIDTDASFCVVSETMAGRLGIRVLDTAVTIITSTHLDQPMHLGVADEMKFGDAVLTNVVFAVLPDRALRFSSTYTMDAVIGLPVFVALGRLELVGGEGLYYGARPNAPGATEANMALSGLDPFALLKDERTGATLRLAIDTAADKTTLNATALGDFPALAEGTSSGWASWQGAGGSRSDNRARTIPEWRLSVAGRPISLKRIKILSTAERDRNGAVGQDLLKQGKRWVLDFDHMSFTIGD